MTSREYAVKQMEQLSQGSIGETIYISGRHNIEALAISATEQLGWFKYEQVQDEYCVWKMHDLL
jgi:hypothetical protein